MRKAGLFIGASVGAMVTIATPAMAQTAELQQAEAAMDAQDSVGDIVVTARKRNELLQDVPTVVSVVTGELADALGGIQNARDLVALSPGITFIEGANAPIAEPNIRGAGPARLPNSDAAVGLYRNGAYIVGGNLGGRTFQRFDMFDLERTEVLRGPQGALYGRNAVGGAINVISRKPQFTNEGEVRLIGGSQESYGGQAIVNMPLSDNVAIRVGGDFRQQDGGFYRRSDTGAVYDNEYYAGGRLGLRYKPSEVLDIVLQGDYSDEKGGFAAIISRDDTDGDIFLLPRNGIERRGASQLNVSLNVEWDVGAATLTSVSNYRHRDSFGHFDNDATDVAVEQNLNFDKAETFFQELRASGSSSRLNWLVGADLFYLRDFYDQHQEGREIKPATMAMAAVNPNFTQATDYSQTGYAAFGSLEYRPVDRFAIEVEGRYSIDKKDLLIDAKRADGTPRYSDFPPGSPQTMPHNTFRNFSYGVTASFHASEAVLAFARVATAYRAGGFNSELGNPCDPGEVPGTTCNLVDVPPSYDEEHSINYELGVKTSWFNHRLTLNANGYFIEYDDILANLNNGIMPMVDPLNGAMFLDNAGRAEAWGYEIEMSANPKLPSGLGTLRVNASYAHQNGKFTDVKPGVAIALDNRIPRLRPSSITANALWRMRVAEGARLFVAGNYIRQLGGFQDPDNSYILDDVHRVNARAGIEWRAWELAFRVNNLTNTRYFLNQSGPETRPGIGTDYRINSPRTLEASLRFRW
ncbi:TonB-dependent receptor [Hephaestia sp. GCM10023244]|uniref:TonB-dependent receptor n=1 Tax=unclassified Hephaestia TaxID=2631281 RepID=UPI0020776F36|nr:TonB-dependent receptor [Hephaestia sp. MAHUQ-44]MCM8732491.1 TonB-dependent receptor [Hephaestia sp. MAHUQ-44]